MSKTYSEILTDAKARISDNILKGEGSLVHNDLSAFAFEVEALYQQADYLLNQIDPETADYDYLVILAKQRGVTPAEATAAVVKIVGDVAIPIGARFSMSAYNYVITEQLEGVNTYAAECEQTGSAPNSLTGELIPITYISGLSTASITEILVPGEDADDRDALYAKYVASFNNQSFAGNIAAYQTYVDAYEGVGGCKVHPVWNGPGTVKVTVIGADFRPVSSYLIQQITEAAYNDIVPIGADCTFVSAESATIDIVLGLTYASGYSWEVCESGILAVLENYLSGVREAWEATGADGHSVLYLSRVQAALLDVEGVLDVTSTTINGVAASLALGVDQVPVLGEVSEA